MSDFSDFKTQIAEYADRADWADNVITGFIRQAEAKFNSDLRVDRQIKTVSAIITGRCMEIPDDWLELTLVLIGNDGSPNGLTPIQYLNRDTFFKFPDSEAFGYYTYIGRHIFFGGAPDATNGLLYELNYYGEVPVFSDAVDSWVYTKHPRMYLFSALAHAAVHAVGEEDKAGMYEQQTDAMIQRLNDAHRISRASGSRLRRPRSRSFG